MCKTLFASVALGACAGLASAQSNVTVYGTIDGGVRYQTNTNAAGDSLSTQTSGHYLANRLGFRGEEDLGGGLKALFTLESGFFTDTGAQDVAGNIFNRTAAVGIGNKNHTLMLGRQYTIAYRIIGAYDPFSFRFPTLAPLISGAGTFLPQRWPQASAPQPRPARASTTMCSTPALSAAWLRAPNMRQASSPAITVQVRRVQSAQRMRRMDSWWAAPSHRSTRWLASATRRVPLVAPGAAKSCG
jgi:hypothetical protein